MQQWPGFISVFQVTLSMEYHKCIPRDQGNKGKAQGALTWLIFLLHEFQQAVIGKQEKGTKMHLTDFAYEPKLTLL